VRKFDTYATYISDVKNQGAVANRISASCGLNTRVTSPLSPEEGLVQLAEVATRRSMSSERATLLAQEDTLAAIRALKRRRMALGVLRTRGCRQRNYRNLGGGLHGIP